MRRLLEIVLVQLFFLGCAIASEQQTTPGVLVIDVYSVTVPSDVIREKDFMMWARELQEGKADPKQYLPTLQVEHALGGAFDIAKEAEQASPPKVEVVGQEAPATQKEAQPEANLPKVVVAGHVAPTAEQGAYRITFSELGRPPAYSGKTGLTIRPQERRVLLLPMVDLGDHSNLGTVVFIWYKTTDENGDNGDKSRFEIN